MIWFDNSRIIAIFAVVFFHVAGGVLFGCQAGSWDWWVGNLYASMVAWCVPVFVMISGALLLDPAKSEALPVFYRKRASRILIPLLAWSFMYAGARCLKGHMRGDACSVSEMFKSVLCGNSFYHMWYLYMLLGLYFFTPVFRDIVRQMPRNRLVFFVCAAFVISGVDSMHLAYAGEVSRPVSSWFLSFVPYFFCGYLVATTRTCPGNLHLWFAMLVCCTLGSVGCFLQSEAYAPWVAAVFQGNLSVNVIAQSVVVMFILKNLQRPIFGGSATRKISALTLGIYLIHPAVLNIAHSCTGIGVESFRPILSVPAIAIVAFGISLLLTWIISSIPYVRKTV